MLSSMMDKKIAFYDAKPWEINLIESSFEKDSVVFCSDALCSVNLKNTGACEQVEIISSFINSDLSSSILKSFPNLKYIATRSTGFDHIDLEYCRQNSIKVSNVPNYGRHTVAEHAMTLLLCVAKRIPESITRVENGGFNPEGLTGVDLHQKTIGILGTGNIGASMIRMCLGMGMKVVAYDLKESEELSSSLGFKYVSIDDLYSQSDFISIHLPYLKTTHHIIDASAISKMRTGVYLINTARGSLIDTKALIQALRSGKVGGAGLDVLENEKDINDELSLLTSGQSMTMDEAELIIQNNALIKLPNVVVTPHNAFNTAEALDRITTQTVQNIKSFISGAPINLVD
jgi:D-lactate dehydrogenase